MRVQFLLMCLEFYTSASFKIEPLWTYDDETKWPGDRCKGGGKRQSPIDIKTAEVIRDFNKDFIKYGDLQFIGYRRVLVSGINNGHTVQFTTEGDTGMHPMLRGGPLEHWYRLEQMHFHWLSEHALDGVKYPMEIHFVHIRANMTVSDAMKKKDGLAIVSVFCNVHADLEDSQQDSSEEVMQHIPDLMETGDRISGVILDMTKLLRVHSDYYTYAGSLTSPNCNEAVFWIIFEQPFVISDAQYRVFGQIGIGRYNFRSLQKVVLHQVFSPAYTRIHTPKMILFLEKMVNIVSEFFTKVNKFISRGIRSY